LAVSTANVSPSVVFRHPHGAQLLGQVDRPGPLRECRFHGAIDLGIIGKQLQTRAGADAVVGDGQHDAPGVAVVGHFVAGAFAELFANVRGRRGVR
jgi:hypothetical protein